MLTLKRPANRPLIIAHRGFRACFPENTRLAFEHSLGRSDMIELDVRLSGDTKVVVFHDELLTRTSDAAGVAPRLGKAGVALRDWNLEELRQLDLGSWFVRDDPFGTLSSGLISTTQLLPHLPQRIATLEEVLFWSVRHHLPVNIELKELGREIEMFSLAEEVLTQIRHTQTEHLVLLSSFYHPVLAHCCRLAPEIALAALQEGVPPPSLPAYLRHFGVCAYHPRDALVDRALISELAATGISVNVFTVNDPQRIRQLAGFGVNGIFTDYPALDHPGRP